MDKPIRFNTEVYSGAAVHYCNFDKPLISDVIYAILEKFKKWPKSSVISLIEITPKQQKPTEVINLENGSRLALSEDNVKLLPLMR